MPVNEQSNAQGCVGAVDIAPPPNARLVGIAGGRNQLDTPALIVELQALTRNIARMAEFSAMHGVKLRPHVKTHKSIEIASRQVAAGAIGVSCATLGEAEVMVGGGIPGVLITSPVVTAGKISRLIDLTRRAGPGGVLIVVDHPRNVADLLRATAGLDHPLDILIDFDAGQHRTGAANEAAVLDLAALVHDEPRLRLRGLQAYAGHLQHIAERPPRSAAAAEVRATVARIVAGAARGGIQFEIVTGAGTGTYDFDSEDEVFTELQTGSYVFMDAEYAGVLTDGVSASPFEIALFVQTAVVSVNNPDWVTVDGGTKSFATDGGVPVVARGVDPASRYAFFGDEHGKLMPIGPRPDLGARIEFVTPHCDPTVNLHDVYHVVDGDALIDIWKIDARGKR
ncbi:DSD1 family PLP-dependent enzyme [Agrobacterium rhizogenes]|nr:DSD1 family PLP-dependent enzyme [Rhizobium rhizogenes]